MKLLVARSILGVAGALLLFIGLLVLFNPASIASANGVTLSDSPSLLSEYRAPGGMLIVSAVIILIGALRKRFMRLAFSLAAMIYCSYGISRLIGMIFDGMPSASLTQAAIIELVVGSICLAYLFWLNHSSKNHRRH